MLIIYFHQTSYIILRCLEPSRIIRMQWVLFAYNWVGGDYPKGRPAWVANEGNIDSEDLTIWNDYSLPSFVLPTRGTGSGARGAGIDVSNPYTINSITYPALPGMQSSGSAPDMGAVQN